MNGIYLHFLLREISSRLVNAHVDDVLIGGRIVQVVFDEFSLYVSLYPTALGMFLSKKTKQSYKSIKKISEMIKSCRVVDVMQSDFMPVFSIILERSFPKKQTIEIVVSFYPQAPNFSMKHAGRRISIFPRYIEKKPKASVLDVDEEQLGSSGVEYLVREFEGIDKRLARELNKENVRLLKAMVKGKPARPKLVSAKPLHVSLFAQDHEGEYPSFNELYEKAVNDFTRTRDADVAEQQKRLTIRNMRRRVARLQKKLLSQKEIENLKVVGESILANMARIRKGSISLTVLDPYTQTQRKIELDPHLSPQGNALRYFAKYKKEKRGQPRIREQINKITEEMKTLESRPYEKVEVGVAKERKARVREPFHKFVLDSGSVVLVGKNARSNDELTFKHARPSDYFFHTRGYEGAHVLLRPNIPKGQRPSREEIRLAASIAAYFSKAKKQSNVPVSYTQRKYLKKSKKGKIGSVLLMREEVTFVEPELPTKNSH
jgi:predicted ribosome quality control (RQC) complex YloA/Tae2 family protein